jgi:ABC-type amino acid transport substrate-binding protein
MPAVPPNAELAAMLRDRRVDAFAANRTRMEELARAFPEVRVLPDNFTVLGQAIAVAKGQRARLDSLNRFIADALASGLVKESIERARIPGVEAATVNSGRAR